MTSFTKAALFATGGLLVAAPALAQMAGTYTGMNNEGQGVQVVVAAASGGGFEITGISDGGTVYCTARKTYGYGIAFGGLSVPIVGGKAAYKDVATTVAIKATFSFKGTTVKGGMTFTVPILLTAKTAAACATKPQTYTATLGGADARIAPGAHAEPVAAH